LSLNLKLALFAFLLAILLAAQWGMSLERERRILIDEAQERAMVLVRTMAELARDSIASARYGTLDRQVLSFMGERDAAYARILDDRSRIVAASQSELVGWSISGSGAGEPSLKWTRELLIARAPIMVPGLSPGTAELAFFRAPLDAKLSRSLALLLRFLAAELALFTAFVVLMVFQLLLPVRSLVARLEEARPGTAHSPIHLPKAAAPEIRQIAAAVDTLRFRVAEYQAEILAEERMATIGRMAADVAHEIRNPLEAISGAVEYLAGDESEDNDFIRVIREEVRNLNTYLTGVLEFARTGGSAHEPCDLGALARETAMLAGPLAREAGIPLVLDILTSPCFASRTSIKRALFNLVLNAIEASPKGSPVIIHTERQDTMSVLMVRDQGPGIDPEMGEKIFEPYFTTKIGGTGLGLALTRRVVEDHGGTLSIQREDRGGTLALISLPTTGEL
jgi:signal transduction histidine kinase